MKWRTFLKRESRFWNLDALQMKRDYSYKIIRYDSTLYTSQNRKQQRAWLKARALYYEAYKYFYDDFDAGALQVRLNLCEKIDKATQRAMRNKNRLLLQTTIIHEKD